MSKTVLVVAAHPDDETLGMGGTIARLVGEGHTVHVATMTDGVGARHTLTDELHDARERREAEFRAAVRVVGARSVVPFGFADNKMDGTPLLDVVRVVESLIAELRPATVYTHHAGDLNVDHQRTAQAVVVATRAYPGQTVQRVYAFEVPESTGWAPPGSLPFVPARFVCLTRAHLLKKLEALRCYESEFRDPPHPRSPGGVGIQAEARGSQCGHHLAEAFAVLKEIVA